MEKGRERERAKVQMIDKQMTCRRKGHARITGLVYNDEVHVYSGITLVVSFPCLPQSQSTLSHSKHNSCPTHRPLHHPHGDPLPCRFTILNWTMSSRYVFIRRIPNTTSNKLACYSTFTSKRLISLFNHAWLLQINIDDDPVVADDLVLING